jgi:hypothetical protein
MKEEKEVLYWTMKNGKKIDIDQMSENHLRNTLKMIVRGGKENDTTSLVPIVMDTDGGDCDVRGWGR